MTFYQLSKYLGLFICLWLVNGCGGGEKEVTNLQQETIELSIESNTPSTSQLDVTLGTSIEVKFNSSVDKNSISTVLKRQDTGEVIDGSIAFNSDGFTFSPTQLLLGNITYSVTVNYNASPNTPKIYTWIFSTVKIELPEERSAGSFHPPILNSGKTSFLITPIESVKPKELTKVSFGIPFPKGYLSNISQFRILDENNDEIAIAVKEVLPWRYINNAHTSVRSALVQFELEFETNEFGMLQPRGFTLEWGISRATNDLPIEPARDSWVVVDDEEYPASDSIYEPLAYALFNPTWYGDSVIKTRLLPLGTHSDFSAYDTAFKLFGDTAINHVDPRVIDDNLIPHRESYAAWLFDRAMTIYQLAFRTGEFKYLRSAHRASQFYLQLINEQGYFSLKASNDMKYSYGESLVADYILFGDERIPEKVESMVPAWDSFNSDYKLSTNFWTERHAAFQLKGYVTAYELTGKIEYKHKAYSTFRNLKKMQDDPEGGIPKTGALMHTSASHGEGDEQFIASPWMSVLLIDAVERYYIQFENNEVVDFTNKIADYFQQENIALYEWKGYQENDSFFVPYYLAGAGLSDREHGGIGANDLEHAVDVTKIFSSAYFYSCAIERCNQSYLKTISRLYNTAFIENIPHWIRAAAPELGKSPYRLAPPRKFNWWFNTTANNDFLLGNAYFPLYKDNAPYLELTQSNIGLDNFKPGDDITFNFQLKNTGTTTAKNIVIRANSLIKSPEGLLEVTEISGLGVKAADEVIWLFESLSPNQEIIDLSFTVLVKGLPTLQSIKRPVGNILSFADASYCDQSDLLDDCVPWVNVWDSGEQTYKIQSNWLSISPITPITPPNINIISPINFQVVSGIKTLSASIYDTDSIAKVEFLLDGELIQTLQLPPYQVDIQFDALSPLTHEVTVKAWDAIGSEAQDTIYVEAKNPDVTAPQINIISPKPQNEYCNSVVVQYDISEQFTIDTCKISLNDKYIISPNCEDFEVSSIIPLFSAKAYLPLDEKNDIIQSTNQFGLTGNVAGAVWNIEPNRTSLSFNGIEDYVDFSVEDLDLSNNITVSFWLNPQSDEGMIMSQDWGYIGNEFGWAISLGANNHKDNNTLSITWSSGTNGSNLNSGNVVQTPSYSVSLENWQHVVVRKLDKQVDIFINGALVTSKQLIDGDINWPFNSGKKFTLAKAMKHPDMYNRNLHGLLDDIAIWNEVLTDEAITRLYLMSPQSAKIHNLEVTAKDKAGNIGTSSVDFVFKSCS